MKITPIDIQQQQFKGRMFGGLDQEDVDVFLQSVAAEMEGIEGTNLEGAEALPKISYADKMIDHMKRFVKNVPDVILARHIDSPVDMERTSPSFRRGDLHGIATSTYQSGAHRPTPELGQYTVPGLDGFYLVGPFQHPGGGVFGAGRATAMKMFEALKMDFDRQGRVK